MPNFDEFALLNEFVNTHQMPLSAGDRIEVAQQTARAAIRFVITKVAQAEAEQKKVEEADK